jgi:hypothetical protein
LKISGIDPFLLISVIPVACTRAEKAYFFAPAAVPVLVNRAAHRIHLQRAEPDKLDLLSQDIAGDKQV